MTPLRTFVAIAFTVAFMFASGSVASGQGTGDGHVPEGDRQPPPREQPPSRRQPAPTIDRPAVLGCDDFVACYRAIGRPEITFVHFVNIEHGEAMVKQRRFINQIGESLANRFAVCPDIRVRSDLMPFDLMEDAEFQRRMNANPTGAAAIVAEQLDTDFLVLFTASVQRDLAGGVTEYGCSFTIIDQRRDRRLGGRPFTIRDFDDRASPREQLALVEGVAKHTVDQMVRQLNRQCEPRGDGPADRLGAPANAPQFDIELTVTGDYQNEDIRDLVAEMRRLRRVGWVDPNPQVRDEPRSVSLEMTASASPFDLADELAGAIFLATEKDAHIRHTDDVRAHLDVQHPMYATWIGEETRRNRSTRERFEQLYRERGRPRVLVLLRRVDGITDRVVTPWYWHYELVPAVEPAEAAAVRTSGAMEVRNALSGTLRAAGIRPANLIAVQRWMQQNGFEGDRMNNSVALFDAMGSSGVDHLIEINGRLDLRTNREEPMRFTARLFNVQTAEELAATGAVGCMPAAGDPMAGAECSNEVGAKLAAQTLELLRDAWLGEPEWMHVVIADARTVDQSQRIQEAIEAVPGVEYTSFLALGDRGMVLEVAHDNADDAVRAALNSDGLPFRLELAEGATRSRLMVTLRDPAEASSSSDRAEPADTPAPVDPRDPADQSENEIG